MNVHATKSLTVKPNPPHIFNHAWPLVDQLLLCEALFQQLKSIDSTAPVTSHVVDWNDVLRVIVERSTNEMRFQYTPGACFHQINTLATSILRSTQTVCVDSYATIYKCLTYLRDVRIKELEQALTMALDCIRIYTAESDYIDGRPFDPKLLNPATFTLPKITPPPTFYFSLEPISHELLPVPNGNATILTSHIVPKQVVSRVAPYEYHITQPDGTVTIAYHHPQRPPSPSSNMSSGVVGGVGADPASASQQSGLPPPSTTAGVQDPIPAQSSASTLSFNTTPAAAAGAAPFSADAYIGLSDSELPPNVRRTIYTKAYNDPYSVHNPETPKVIIQVPQSTLHYVAVLTPRLMNISILHALVTEISTNSSAPPFYYPVREGDAPGYFDIITKPMDFTTMMKMIHTGNITDAFQLYHYFSQIYINAYTYNAKATDVWLLARELDFFTASLFKATFPEYAQIFTPVTQDTKKIPRKQKITKGTTQEKPPVLPISRDPSTFIEDVARTTPSHLQVTAEELYQGQILHLQTITQQITLHNSELQLLQQFANILSTPVIHIENPMDLSSLTFEQRQIFLQQQQQLYHHRIYQQFPTIGLLHQQLITLQKQHEAYTQQQIEAETTPEVQRFPPNL